MAAVVIISGGRGLRIEACHRNQPNKSKLCCISSYFHFNIHLNNHKQATRWSTSVLKVGEGYTRCKVFERRAGLGCR